MGVLTKLLATKCAHLTAVDISPLAIEEAQTHCQGIDGLTFQTLDVSRELPKGTFDLIVCSEVGYYMDAPTLERLFVKLTQRLVQGGQLLLVHWTGFVPDYPLTGDEVHQRFQTFVSNQATDFEHVAADRQQRYRLDVWQKG